MISKFHTSKTFYIIVIIFIATLFFFTSYAQFGMFFVDTSREVYIPMAMNNNSVLYKDILNVYPPLAYQINSIFLKVFGHNLQTFYYLGFTNSLLFITGFYLLVSQFTTKKFSFLLSVFVIISCVFCVSQANYILPYSYSTVYGLTAITWSLFALILFIKEHNEKYITLAFLLFGITLCFKYDFALFSILLFPILLTSNIANKTKVLSILFFALIPTISFLLLLIEGCNISDIKDAIEIIYKLFNAEHTKICYKYMGLIPNINSLLMLITEFIETSLFLVFCFVSFYILHSKLNNKKLSIILISIIVTALSFYLIPVSYYKNPNYFDWIGLFFIAELIAITLYLYFKKKKNSLNENDKIYFILMLSVFFIGIKGVAAVNLNNYGTYYLPLYIVATFIPLFHYLREILKIKDEDSLQEEKTKGFLAGLESIKVSITAIIILVCTTYLFSNMLRRTYHFSTPVTSQKGIILTEKDKASSIQDLLNYIQKETTNNDTILVLPEGAMINFLSDRKSDDKYYYLIPPNIDIFGEDKIVNDLEKNLPDYIIIYPALFQNFHETYFCESFGNKICNIIPKYYEHQRIIKNENSNFWITIYKLKK